MKVCNTCNIAKPLEEFSFKIKSENKRSGKCKSCFSIYVADWYNKNRSIVLARQPALSKAARRRREDLRNSLKDQPCKDCGVKYPYYVMDFDHVTGTKVGNVGVMVAGKLAALMEEIAKCEIVCANCHRIRTHKRRYPDIAQEAEAHSQKVD
jgi:hypothetical protein